VTPDTFPKKPDPSNALVRNVRTKDPGSKRAARIGLWLGLLLVLAVFVLNQSGNSAAGLEPTALQKPPTTDPLALASKLGVRLAAAARETGGPDGVETIRKMIGKQIQDQAVSDVDRARGALLVGEFIGPSEGLARIDALEADEAFKLRTQDGYLYPLAPLVKTELTLFRKVLEATPPVADALDDAEEAKLIADHGWIGKLALARGLPSTDVSRQAVERGWQRMVIVLSVLGVVVGVGSLGAVGCFIAAFVLGGIGRLKPRFVRPLPGGSVYIEMLPVFVAGFLLVSLGLPLLLGITLGKPAAEDLRWKLAAQWLLVPLCFWPLWRGSMTWRDFAERLGWDKGRGVFKEIACGIGAYLALLPIYAVVVLLTVLAVNIKHTILSGGLGGGGASGSAPQLPSNPILDIIINASTLELVMFFVLATCWAPLVEEAVFRGGVYRHLRSRLPVVLCAAISAILFGAMHGYDPLLLGPVICLGFGFALVREWRSSLIAPMAGHFIHNAVTLTFVISMLSIIKD